MKKNKRLNLNRETLRSLNEPALLGLARGGDLTGNPCITTNPDTGSDANTNCYPTSCSSRGQLYQ